MKNTSFEIYDVTEHTHTHIYTYEQCIIIWKRLIDSQLRLIGIKYLHSDETLGER